MMEWRPKLRSIILSIEVENGHYIHVLSLLFSLFTFSPCPLFIFYHQFFTLFYYSTFSLYFFLLFYSTSALYFITLFSPVYSLIPLFHSTFLEYFLFLIFDSSFPLYFLTLLSQLERIKPWYRINLLFHRIHCQTKKWNHNSIPFIASFHSLPHLVHACKTWPYLSNLGGISKTANDFDADDNRRVYKCNKC